MKFNPGDAVVCINCSDSNRLLVEGKKYTVDYVSTIYLYVKELEGGWDIERFVPYNRNKLFIKKTSKYVSEIVQQLLFSKGYEWYATGSKLFDVTYDYIQVDLATKKMSQVSTAAYGLDLDTQLGEIIKLINESDCVVVELNSEYKATVYKDKIVIDRHTFDVGIVKKLSDALAQLG